MIIRLFGTVLGLAVVQALADQGFMAFVVPTGSLLVVDVLGAIATQ